MSVALTLPIQHRPFRGYDDPGLPSGIWIVLGSVLGDATGGFLNLDLVFKDGSRAVPESSQLYNLEQLYVFSTLDSDHVIAMIPANWDEDTPGSTGAISTVISLLLSTPVLLSGSAGLGRDINGMHPLFLGQVRKNATNTIIRFSMSNTAVSLAVKAEGYFWGPEALNAPGGPRRPVDSLYG